jgi:hypothetical protein
MSAREKVVKSWDQMKSISQLAFIAPVEDEATSCSCWTFSVQSSMDRDELEQIDGPIFDISSQLRV